MLSGLDDKVLLRVMTTINIDINGMICVVSMLTFSWCDVHQGASVGSQCVCGWGDRWAPEHLLYAVTCAEAGHRWWLHIRGDWWGGEGCSFQPVAPGSLLINGTLIQLGAEQC